MKTYGYWTQDNIDQARREVPMLRDMSDDDFNGSIKELVDAGFLTWNGSVYLLTIPEGMR